MISISIAGIGGQGNVLSAKILAQAALAKGWQVRSAETTGMAQRGGDVTSHVRMGSDGEAVYAPIPVKGTVDVIIAMEPGEGARALPLLKKGGLMVMAPTGMPPATGGVKANAYDPQAIIAELRRQGVNLLVVDDQQICQKLGSRKALNIVMLAATLAACEPGGPAAPCALTGKLTLQDMREAIPQCVKPAFVDMNLAAIDLAASTIRSGATASIASSADAAASASAAPATSSTE